MVGVAYGEDIDRVMNVLDDICREMAHDEQFGRLILEEPVVQGVEGRRRLIRDVEDPRENASLEAVGCHARVAETHKGSF